MSPSILVVDDDETIRQTLVEFFATLGFPARAAATASEGRRAMAEHSPDVALIDLRLPDADGLTLLEVIRADDPEIAIIVLTGHGAVSTAVRAMQDGAVDFLEKPVDLETLQAAVIRAAEIVRMRREISVLRARETAGDAGGLAVAPTVDRLIELAARNGDAPVLLIGETGTGKGFVARTIHDRSDRRAAPFVEVNCASLTSTFFESELFGHERGAFTDAKQAKRGLLEVAARGTVFLDEIAELSPESQPRLLKVIEERTFRRLGGIGELRSEARVITATNQPLLQAMESRRFRPELYYRLQVLTIELPPLRAQRERIEPLARALLPRGATLSRPAEAALAAYDWPGNIRELKNTLWRASILAEGAPITAAMLALPSTRSAVASASDPPAATLAMAEARAIDAALLQTGGNRAKAAQLLGIARSTLHEKLRARASA
ncbi:MAG: sigma-54-dependent Fis family transcriptional regulator [Gemmatimonadaceae bacterium]|nr:sigma-54-dependent Fis family transcriptional regulator [Gemmatimonadaceae bacterium]